MVVEREAHPVTSDYVIVLACVHFRNTVLYAEGVAIVTGT